MQNVHWNKNCGFMLWYNGIKYIFNKIGKSNLIIYTFTWLPIVHQSDMKFWF